MPPDSEPDQRPYLIAGWTPTDGVGHQSHVPVSARLLDPMIFMPRNRISRIPREGPQPTTKAAALACCIGTREVHTLGSRPSWTDGPGGHSLCCLELRTNRGLLFATTAFTPMV